MDLNLWKRTKKERGMTYQDISDRSGIPLGTIKNIFAGYTPDPRESTIKAIELALGVETIIERHYTTPTPSLPADEQHLLEVYRKLNTYNRMKVTAQAEIRLEEQEDNAMPRRK